MNQSKNKWNTAQMITRGGVRVAVNVRGRANPSFSLNLGAAIGSEGMGKFVPVSVADIDNLRMELHVAIDAALNDIIEREQEAAVFRAKREAQKASKKPDGAKVQLGLGGLAKVDAAKYKPEERAEYEKQRKERAAAKKRRQEDNRERRAAENRERANQNNRR